MLAAVLYAKWDPKPNYSPTRLDIPGKVAFVGNLVWRYPKLKLEEKPIPEIKEDEVLIKVGACGICGSDIHMYETTPDGYIIYPAYCGFPITPGHEFSGEIIKAGEKALDEKGERFKEGDIVTVEEMHWCGVCKACRDGYPNHCINIQEIGFTEDGGFAEYVKTKAKYCWSIKEIEEAYGSREAAIEAGALVEPTSVAYNGIFIRAGGFQPGATIVIFGAGPIGLACTSLAKASGAAKIIVVEVFNKRLELAKEVGADYLINPKKIDGEVWEKILELTNGEGADMYIEAAGNIKVTWPNIEKSIWNGMKINSKSLIIGRAESPVPVWFETQMTRRSVIHGSLGHSGHGIFKNVIRLMSSKRIDMRKIITARFKLENIIDAFETISKHRDMHAKILIKP